MIPYLDGPVSTAASKDARMEVVPPDSVHRHVMGVVRIQILRTVMFATLVDLALLRSHQEQIVCELVEVETRATCWRNKW